MEENNKKESLYTMSNLTEFRKSIAKMGTTVPNGNVILDPVKLRREPRLNIDDILKTPYNDKQAWRIYSRIFYGDSLYRRVLKYLSTLLYNHYMISPVFANEKKPNKKKLMNDYNSLLRCLDEDMNVETFTQKVLLDLLIEGETFYYLEEYKKGASVYYKPIKLPADYCRIIGTAGTPNINIFAVDLTFIDTVLADLVSKNILTREEVLKQYPKEMRKAYEDYKGARLGRESKQWFVVPVQNGIAFTTEDGRPPFAYLVKTLARIDKFEVLRDDYIATNLTKLLVQIIDIDKEGNPEVDLEMAADFHKNLRAIAEKKNNVDALTTLAKEVDVLSLGETGDATKNYEFLKTYYDQFFDDAGISEEMFNATTGSTLDYSLAKDEAFMYDLRRQVETWFNYFITTICNKRIIKNTKFVFSFLETSYKNREKMIESYIEGATYGFSKIVPQVALGVKQRYIESLNTFENEVLNLGERMVPLQSSHTMSNKANESENSETSKDVESTPAGRPEKDQSEKQDSTVTKDASL